MNYNIGDKIRFTKDSQNYGTQARIVGFATQHGVRYMKVEADGDRLIRTRLGDYELTALVRADSHLIEVVGTVSNVISIMKPVKNPSRSFMESVRKARGVRGKKPNREERRFNEKWYRMLNYNIDYYKKHGKLPEKDMAKVQGKGMYGQQ